MAYDKQIADRLRGALHGIETVSEKKMFGGIAFMVGGHMCCGVVGDELMVRVGPHQYEVCLALGGAREMDFTGKPMRGFVYVAPEGFSTEASLQQWVERALGFVHSLPPRP